MNEGSIIKTKLTFLLYFVGVAPLIKVLIEVSIRADDYLVP